MADDPQHPEGRDLGAGGGLELMTMTRRLRDAPPPYPCARPHDGAGAIIHARAVEHLGTGTYGGALWVGSGVAPYDRFADGAANAAGLRMQQAERAPCGSVECLFSYASGGVYVPSLQQFVALLASGHQGGGSNEVNVFDMRTGTWNPSGRPANPTVRLYVKHGATWPELHRLRRYPPDRSAWSDRAPAMTTP